MQVPPYSIAIRTIGKAGDKYQRLLDAIGRLKPQPRDVIVVIPNGYDLPTERLGREIFVRSDKGMVKQRVAGGKAAHCEHILFLDDDLDFPADLVEKLYAPVGAGLSSISFPIMLEMLPAPGIRSLIWMLLGTAVPMLLDRETFYVKVLANGGWSYNRFRTPQQPYYYSHSAAGACFFATKQAFLAIDFESESWVESAGYALLEDQVMFFKSHCCGTSPIGVSGAGLVHLDGGVAQPGRRAAAFYAASFNRTVFWHRFIYTPTISPCRRFFKTLCFAYSTAAGLLYSAAIACLRLSLQEFRASLRGLSDARTFLSSGAYRGLDLIPQPTAK